MKGRIRVGSAAKWGLSRYPNNNRHWRGYHVGPLLVVIFAK